MSNPDKKLDLETETVSELNDDQLENIAGGSASEIVSAIMSGAVSALETTTTGAGIIASAAASASIAHHVLS